MTWEEQNEGITYKYFFKYIEMAMNCTGHGKISFRGKSVEDIQNKFGLWFWMFVGLLIEILQRLADLPYLDIAYSLGDGCNLVNATPFQPVHQTKWQRYLID